MLVQQNQRFQKENMHLSQPTENMHLIVFLGRKTIFKDTANSIIEKKCREMKQFSMTGKLVSTFPHILCS